MCALSAETRDYLENNTDLELIVIDAMLAEETRPRALVKDDGALVNLHAMNLYEGEEPEDMISIQIWIDEKKVITTRRRDIKAIDDIVECIQQQKGPVDPSEFLTMITDRVYERMEPFCDELEDCISIAEEKLATGKYSRISEDVAIARKRTAIFIRNVTPQKTLLETLLNADLGWLKEESKEHLVESHDRVTRYTEELYELRDRSQILSEEINNAHARRLNGITYIFSVAATIFLPLTFLTGIMGINIGGMPGLESSLAFWVFTSLCIVIIIVQVALFKKLKWF
jgi:zinc transporter